MFLDRLIQRLTDEFNIATGGNGTVLHTGTGVSTKNVYSVLQINQDTVFTTLTDSEGIDLMVDLGIGSNTCIAGSIIKAKYGKTIDTITLASGSLWGIIK